MSVGSAPGEEDEAATKQKVAEGKEQNSQVFTDFDVEFLIRESVRTTVGLGSPASCQSPKVLFQISLLD